MIIALRRCSGWQIASVLVHACLLGLVLWRMDGHNGLGPVPLGLLGLLVIIIRDVAGFTEHAVHGRIGLTVVCMVALAFHALGSWVDSNSMRLMGLGFLSLAWMGALYGWRNLGGLVLLLGLICIPQGLLNDSVLLVLQRVSAGMASWGMDLARIPHLPQGAVLVTAKGNLFVEEACSGMQSLLTGLVVAQVYFSWHRMGVWLSAAGLACAAILLVLGNSLRIFLISLLYAVWSIDWTGGWRHELTGVAVYLAVLALLPGIRLMLISASQGFLRWRYPWLVALDPGNSFSGVEQAIGARMERMISGLPAMAAAVLALMASISALEIGLLGMKRGETNAAHLESLPNLDTLVLPREVHRWRQDPAGRETGFLKGWALDHNVWSFRNGRYKAWVAADLPFATVHPLPMCYAIRDWHVLRDESLTPAGMSPFTVMELHSKHAGVAPLIVIYDNYDLGRHCFVNGAPHHLVSRWEEIVARLSRWPGSERPDQGPFCQVQVVLEGGESLESPIGQEALQLFDAVRNELADKLAGTKTKDHAE